MILQPMKQVVMSSGKMDYSANRRAWNRIRLKKDIINEFPLLRRMSFKTNYTAVVFNSYTLLEKEIEDIVEKKRPMPVLLFFEQEI